MRNFTAGRHADEYADFSEKVWLFTAPFLRFAAFVMIFFGSIYGLEKMLEGKTDNPRFWAIIFAVVLQIFAAAAFPNACRALVYWGVYAKRKSYLQGLVNQKPGAFITLLGIVSIIINGLVFGIDTYTNIEAYDSLVENQYGQAKRDTFSDRQNRDIIALADEAVQNAEKAEAAERKAFEAGVEARYAAEIGRLKARKRQKITTEELGWCDRRLAQIEAQKTAQKAAFVPKKSDVAGALAEAARVRGKQTTLIMQGSLAVDSVNVARGTAHENMKSARKGGLIVFYALAWAFLFGSYLIEYYAAFKFDLKESGGFNFMRNLADIFGSAMNSLGFYALRQIAIWLPEPTGDMNIRRTKTLSGGIDPKLLGRIQSDPDYRRIVAFVQANEGCKEAQIYGLFQSERDPLTVRKMLVDLLNADFVQADRAGRYSLDEQAGFFLT